MTADDPQAEQRRVGRNVLDLRRKRGMAQRELAYKIGTTEGTLSRLEKCQDPLTAARLARLRLIAGVLGVPLARLYEADRIMTGVVEAKIVAVRWTAIAGGCRYVEAYENEELFWDSIAEYGAPERCYRLEGDRLTEFDYTAGMHELRDNDALESKPPASEADRMNKFDSLSDAPPVTLPEIELAACDCQIRAVYGFALATFERYGGANNPACMQLAHGALKAVLEACRGYEAAKQRSTHV